MFTTTGLRSLSDHLLSHSIIFKRCWHYYVACKSKEVYLSTCIFKEIPCLHRETMYFWCCQCLIMPPLSEEVYRFTLVRPSRPFVCPSDFFYFLSRVIQKALLLDWWNVINLLIDMWTCATAYFRAVLSDVGGDIALLSAKKNDICANPNYRDTSLLHIMTNFSSPAESGGTCVLWKHVLFCYGESWKFLNN